MLLIIFITIFTRGQFWPLGNVFVCAYVCLSVCLCVFFLKSQIYPILSSSIP